MDDVKQAYRALILRILGNFQLLEFVLKAYIGRAYVVIKLSVGGKIHFDYSDEDVESFPLERLLNVFAKLNGNKELISRLNKLREDRNNIAHKSLLIVMGTSYDMGAAEDKHMEYSWLEDELSECLQLVIGEMQLLKEKSRG